MNKFTVIRDTREKKANGWFFEPNDVCDGTITSKLDTGDYSLIGYDKTFVIERKGSILEFAQNINQERFIREMERLKSFDYSFLLLEFDMHDIMSFPNITSIPFKVQQKIKISSSYILKRLLELDIEYPTKIILCGSHGHNIAQSLFKRVNEKHRL